MRTRARTLAGATALAMLAAACQQQDPAAIDDPEPTEDETGADDMSPPPDTIEQTTLVLMTHDSFDVDEEVLAAFTDESGIGVDLAPAGDAGATVNQAILTRDAPLGDVLFGVDNTFLSRALEADLFVAYESPELEQVDEQFVLDDEHRVTPVTRGDVCLNYDRAWFEENDVPLPDDLADLTDEAYAGRLAVMNPATSSPGLAFLLATVERFGEDGYLDFWEALVDNDVLVTDGWSEAYYDEFSATGEGDRPLVVSYASSPPAEVYYADPPPDEAPTGVIEASCFRQVEFAGILQGTEHEAEARLLIDFLIGPEFQEQLPLTMFVFPVRTDASLPEVFETHAVLPDDPLELAPETIGEGRDAWIEAWTSTVLR
ncbi:thiamine ABC transporter substrate-binding protein [Egicoccus halophilus]|uniref:Thiamine ABC transporter substrate-binding protein n=1 Tax=Egicoccus halophilus TaxID=1670830 RepID=A0A8J3EU20_9ACTN|nr:thiamine ABC transporter substrate-binding protein [Egicoccus halophilus]GGI06765.1 thiamine ABC transporter substrate-binding protein [Egicoccus halophilus]